MEPINNNEEQPENSRDRVQPVDSSDTDNQGSTNPTTPLGMAKEDMLDMSKGAAFMDNTQWTIQGVEGRSISGAGSGPGTGEISADFDRPTTEGTPAINDYVSPESLQEAKDAAPAKADDNASLETQDVSPQNLAHADPASGFPMGGAVRNEEDRLPSGEADETDSGFSPESPLNKPKDSQSAGLGDRE